MAYRECSRCEEELDFFWGNLSLKKTGDCLQSWSFRCKTTLSGLTEKLEKVKTYFTHGVILGTAHGPSTAIDSKLAGPTISRYSISGE